DIEWACISWRRTKGRVGGDPSAPQCLGERVANPATLPVKAEHRAGSLNVAGHGILLSLVSWLTQSKQPAYSVGSLFHAGNIDDLRAAFFDQRPLHRHGLGHLAEEHLFSRLMVFHSHHYIDIAFLGGESDGISRLGARNSAILVLRAVVAAFQITPQVHHFTFDRHLVALWLGEHDGYTHECEDDCSDPHAGCFGLHMFLSSFSSENTEVLCLATCSGSRAPL